MQIFYSNTAISLTLVCLHMDYGTKECTYIK